MVEAGVDVGAAKLGHWVRRPAIVAVTCLVGVFVLGAVSVASARILGPPRGAGFSDALTVATGTVTFSAVVHPHGRATAAYFEYGLALRYREPRPSHIVYDLSTPAVHLASGFDVYSVSGKASGLLPNALYNLRLVASSSAGTVYSPNATFRTAEDPAPPQPVVGAKVNVEPVSGLVFTRPPHPGVSPTSETAALVTGDGFRPLTEPRQLLVGSQIDARGGSVRLIVARPNDPHTQRITLAGGLFSVSQTSQGTATVNLVGDDFPGAPSYNSCPSSAAHAVGGARAVQSSSRVVQTVHATDQAGRFNTLGRASTAAGAAGAVWNTIDRCDGTLTVVQRGTVAVSDPQLHQTIVLDAGQSYLAHAP
jgi:hypothetical protein